MSVKVNSDKVSYESDRIVSQYEYTSTVVTKGMLCRFPRTRFLSL